MTPERAKELLPVITAFAQGQRIEVLDSPGHWTVLEDPYFDSASVYRIAPEPPAPRYRPMTIEEWRERFIRERIVLKLRDDLVQVTCVENDAIRVSVYGKLSAIQANEMLTEADGSPCGVKIEE